MFAVCNPNNVSVVVVVVVSVRVVEPYGKGEGVFTNLKEASTEHLIWGDNRVLCVFLH